MEPREKIARRRDVLPLSLAPRGLSRVEAAAYIGVSAALFDAMVEDGRMPSPKIINARRVWDRRKLDLAFEGLPERSSSNSIDQRQEAADGWDDYK